MCYLGLFGLIFTWMTSYLQITVGRINILHGDSPVEIWILKVLLLMTII